jgi:hypothetical protein
MRATAGQQRLQRGNRLEVALAADFDGDGKADILWQNTDGSLAIWLMDGGSSLGCANSIRVLHIDAASAPLGGGSRRVFPTTHTDREDS